MTKIISINIIYFLIMILGHLSMAEPLPKVYISENGCDKECCIYRNWSVLKDIKLYKEINGKDLVDTIKKKSEVILLKTESYSTPLNVKDLQGKDLYLLNYEGEGEWITWQDGVIKNRFEGEWQPNDQKFQQTVWYQVKTKNGLIGWTNESGSLEDPLGCEEIDVSPKNTVVSSNNTHNELGECDFNVTGISDKKKFIEYFKELQKNINGTYTEHAGSLFLYPLRVNFQKNKSIFIKTKEELTKKWSNIFNQDLIDIIKKQDIQKLFCRDMGIMIGSGQAWITEKKNKIGIYSINSPH